MNYKNLINSIIEGEEDVTVSLANDLLAEGADPHEIIQEGLLAGMDVVSRQFKDGEMFVPEVMMSANAMNDGISLIKPLLKEGELKSLGTVIIGTVEGDLHDIGKNLVAMMMESAGFKIVDLGVDVKPDDFIKAAIENNADIIAMSAMLTTTMQSMGVVSKKCKDEDRPFEIMIGGAPVNKRYGDEINAVYTADSASAVEAAKMKV